jgi:regulator of cell morphogenesis and NO signaling
MTRTSATPSIDPQLTVNELVASHPCSIAVLNALGVDTCCGGALSLRDAAADASIGLPELIAAIEAGVATERSRVGSGR